MTTGRSLSRANGRLRAGVPRPHVCAIGEPRRLSAGVSWLVSYENPIDAVSVERLTILAPRGIRDRNQRG